MTYPQQPQPYQRPPQGQPYQPYPQLHPYPVQPQPYPQQPYPPYPPQQQLHPSQPYPPYPQQQQPYPQWQPAPQGYGQQWQAAEGIAVTTRYFPLNFRYAFTKPKILVDGHEVPGGAWGRTVVPLRPGQHHLHVYIPYLLPSKIGPAVAAVDVQPGRWTELEYKLPVFRFSKGSLGIPPQSYNGVGLAVASLVISLIFALLVLIAEFAPH